MKTETFEHIECKRITVVDKHGREAIRLCVDDTSNSSIHVQSTYGTIALTTLPIPGIHLINKDGYVLLSLVAAGNNGAVQIKDKNGITKLILDVSEDEHGRVRIDPDNPPMVV